MGLFEWNQGCIAQREYVNIPAWHKAGYIGEGISVFCDDADRVHAESVADIVQTILPDARVMYGNISYKSEKGHAELYAKLKNSSKSIPLEEFIAINDISLINNSTGLNRDTAAGGITPAQAELKKILDKYNVIMTGAAGNDADGKITNPWVNVAIMVNSAVLKNGKPAHALSSIGNKIDFCMFTGFQPGTSFAAPFLLGMIGLLRCRYGRSLTQDQAYAYLRDHAEDMRDDGKDHYTGWGLPILGDPEEDYFGGEDMIVTMQIGSAVLDVDGKRTIMDEVPQYNKRGDRMMVPVKYVAEAFGCKTEWDEATKTVRFVR